MVHRHNNFVLDENSPQLYSHGFDEAKKYYKCIFPHASIKNYHASHYGKEAKHSIPNALRRYVDRILEESSAYKMYMRNVKLNELLDE